MPNYANYPGCFVYIRLMVVKDGPNDQLAIRFATVARATDETTPIVSYYVPNDTSPPGSIILPAGESRPFGFALAYDMADANNPKGPGGQAKYTWDPNNILQNIKIWENGAAEPVWGTSLPADFTAPKAHDGLITFIDSNGSDGKSFNYCIRLMLAGSPGVYCEPLDPRITNSGN